LEKIGKDLSAGALFALMGAAGAAYAWSTLSVGTPFRMGPGFFPVVLSVLLFLLGAAKILMSLRVPADEWGVVPWRALVLIPAAMVIFGYLARPLGMVPSLLILCMIAAFASRRMEMVMAIILSIAMTAFCVVLFGFLLRVPLPLFGTWLS
jgi:hypothetical protein